jgi:hypothetical protein
MTDKTVFSDEEWTAVVEAPLLVTLMVVAAGEHGPISMVKEASASARSIAKPGSRGSADGLIAQVAQEAESKEARHDMKQYRGASMDGTIELALLGLRPAAAALAAKLPPDEAAQVGSWLLDIAKAVAAAAKTVNPGEQEAIDKVARLFGVSA